MPRAGEPTIFRTLDIPPDGPAVVHDGRQWATPPPAGTTRWIDLQGQDETQLAHLAGPFCLHPLAIEDCLHLDQRPKLEEYGDYLFIVIHAFDCPGKDPTDARLAELHAFLGAGWLITVHQGPVPALDTVWKRVAGEPALGRKGADFLYYLLADSVVDAHFPILDLIAEELESLEDAVLMRPHRDDLARVFSLKRSLVHMRRVLSPQRDVLAMLSKRGDPRVTERTSFYFRDVYDHLLRIYESIDASRDLLGNTLEAYLSSVSNRTNEIMKRLTLLSAVFLPLTFITGFFGQNFEHLPFASDLLMWSAIVACLAIPTVMVVWFFRSGWF
jgi:magnesium transporter